MAFCFLRDEPLAVGIQRIISKQLTQSVHELDSPEVEASLSIHRARRRCKRLRAMLRMFRDPLGSAFSPLNQGLRDAARQVSVLRDQQAMHKSFQSLLRVGDVSTDHPSLIKHAYSLQAKSDSTLSMASQKAVQEFRDRLSALREQFAAHDVGLIRLREVQRGLRRSYRRAERAKQGFEQDRSIEFLHDWRKRTKDVYYQLRVVRILARGKSEKMRSRWQRLGELLGEARDFSLLRSYIETHLSHDISAEELNRILATCETRQTDLEDQAVKLGDRVLKRHPAKFVSKVFGKRSCHSDG